VRGWVENQVPIGTRVVRQSLTAIGARLRGGSTGALRIIGFAGSNP